MCSAVADRRRGRCPYMTHSTETDARWVRTPAATCLCRCRCVDRTADDWGTSGVSRRTRPPWTHVEWTVEPRATQRSTACIFSTLLTMTVDSISDWRSLNAKIGAGAHNKSYNLKRFAAYIGYEVFKAFQRRSPYDIVTKSYLHVRISQRWVSCVRYETFFVLWLWNSWILRIPYAKPMLLTVRAAPDGLISSTDNVEHMSGMSAPAPHDPTLPPKWLPKLSTHVARPLVTRMHDSMHYNSSN